MHQGYLSLILHAHLPFVRHPEEEYFLEENWLYEAITETYIPLIKVMERLVRDDVDFRLTMSLTPTLVSMLQDPLLQSRYIRHIDRLIELAEKELVRTEYSPDYHVLARMYHQNFCSARETFVEKCRGDLVASFKNFQEMGCLEIMTCAATHGFLPILNVNPEVVRAQIFIGVEHYKKTFGRPPRGIWLPECAYFQGLDKILADAGIWYFIIDSHGLLHSDPLPRYGVYAPCFCPSGVAAFGRDWESSKQVWSSKEGYPGDYDYREYYRDIGFALEHDYIRPYIHPMGFRINTGIKYWRITGNTEYKEVYHPDWAREKAASHAGNFMFNREKQIEHLAHHMDRKPLIIAPYDAELFGHWWYEGPQWIEFLARKICYDQKTVRMTTPAEYLKEYPVNQVTVPSASSWGYKGYAEHWLDGSNDWVYRHVHMAGKRMAELARKFSSHLTNPRQKGLIRRALNQAARELLLAEASDWPFIMKTGTMVPYANKRVTQHIAQFTRLYENLLRNTVDKKGLEELEQRDNIFHDMDCAVYYSEEKYRLPPRPPAAVADQSARKPRKKKACRAKAKTRRVFKPKTSKKIAPKIKDKKLILV
ncbi:MAG: 1,4-alpha-glucan branching protein domain-containing protein [Candidatus Omnitrophota bacterium]|jgi:1,4-alpha-glucan branching enzyme